MKLLKKYVKKDNAKIILIVITVIIFFLIIVLLNLKFVFRVFDDDGGGGMLIGGDKDNYGCLVGAGYQWCPSSEECLRTWEEYCEEFKDNYRVDENKACGARDLNKCDNDCAVCPSCPACSSLGCKSKELCEKQGIDEGR